ncbi:hypothetical protein HY310_02360 [Candidatus Microgenomates bacterium]|nr:hypothetical protein [Candidatus Microgenomates bacterium]
MTFKFLTATTVFITTTVLASSIAMAATLPPRMVLATPAATLKQQQQLAAKLALAAKLDGTITSVGTNSLVVNGVTVNVSSTTVLLRKFGGKSNLTEFNVGHQVGILGKWTDTTKTTLNARVIRNVSIQKRHATFVGTVQSVSPTGFVLQPVQRPVQSVTVTTKTRYVDRREKSISFSSIVSGQKVRVSGLWDSQLNTITNAGLVKDYDLPSSPSGQVKKPSTQTRTPGTSQ